MTDRILTSYYRVNRCIGAKNLPLYWIHILIELINTTIVFCALMVTFNDRIDADLIFFIFYLIDGIGHEFLYLKKFIVHTKTMLTGETLHERYFIPSTYKFYC